MKKKLVSKILATTLSIVMFGTLVGCSANDLASSDSSSGSETSSESSDTSSGSSDTSSEADASSSETAGAENQSGKKVGVLCSPVSWGEENYRMTERCIEKFGEDRIVLNTLPEDADVQTIVSLATDMANNAEIGALVINEAVPGSIAAVKAAKNIKPDLLCIMVNPSEEPPEVSQAADLAVMTVFEEIAIAVADNAAAMGLDVLVMEIPVDQLGMERLQIRVQACQARCEELGITFIQNTLPNESDANARPAMIQAAKEDVYNKLGEYGDNVGFFPHSSFVTAAMLTALSERQAGYFAGTPDPGPFAPGFMDTFGITAAEENVLDMEWTNKALADKIEEAGMTGHISNWEIPYFSTMMYGSIAYSLAYLDGQETTVDINTWMKYAAESYDLDVETQMEFFPYEKDGKTYDNFAMFNAPIKTYGMDMGVE